MENDGDGTEHSVFNTHHKSEVLKNIFHICKEEKKQDDEKIRLAIEKILCEYCKNSSITIMAVKKVEKRNYESSVFSFEGIGVITHKTREDIFNICKITKRISSDPEEQKIQKEKNDEYQKRLDDILDEDAVRTERILTTWEGDKKPRETVVILQERIENAVPLANISIKEIKKDPELTAKVIQFFEKLIVLIETAETLEDLPALWGLEKLLYCSVALNPWFTHNIVIDKDNKKIALVDNSRCQSFYSDKLLCRIAKLYFRLRNGKKRWIKKLRQYQKKLET